MDLWQLNIFCKVVELRSFSRAGNQVHLSQPTISSHIKDLESHFGCQLIDRLAREAIPTSAGELLYRYSKQLIAMKDETESALSEFLGTIRGRIRIGGSTIPGVYILPEVIGCFIREYPQATAALTISDTEHIVQDVLSGAVQLGVVGAKTAEKLVHQEKLMEDALCLAVACNHPWSGRESVSISELIHEPFIIRESGSGTLKSIQHTLRQVHVGLDSLNVVAEMGSTEAVLQGVKSGLGVSIISRLAGTDLVKTQAIRLLTVAGLDMRRSFYLTTLKQKTESPLSRAFNQVLRRCLHLPEASSPAYPQ